MPMRLRCDYSVIAHPLNHESAMQPRRVGAHWRLYYASRDDITGHCCNRFSSYLIRRNNKRRCNNDSRIAWSLIRFSDPDFNPFRSQSTFIDKRTISLSQVTSISTRGKNLRYSSGNTWRELGTLLSRNLFIELSTWLFSRDDDLARQLVSCLLASQTYFTIDHRFAADKRLIKRDELNRWQL